MNRSAKKYADGDQRSRCRIAMEMKGEAFPTSLATWLACMKLIESEAAPGQPVPFTAEEIIQYGKKRHCQKDPNATWHGTTDER